MERPKVIVIVGGTASGKSDLAVDMAKIIEEEKLGGYTGAEIISADSRQVYKGLDIGSGKISEAEMNGIKHHLLDVADPKNRFTAEDYRKLADKALDEIISKNKLPIICGGSGFYIQALLNGDQFPPVKENIELRKSLEDKNPQELLEMLKKLDSNRALAISNNNSEKNNKRRLIRAIEIASADQRQIKPENNLPAKYNVGYFGIEIDKDELHANIHNRLTKRLDSGMLDEARKLHSEGLSYERMDELGLEYRYMSRFLSGKISENEMKDKLETEIKHYAKRQMTWFRANKEIIWKKRARLLESIRAWVK